MIAISVAESPYSVMGGGGGGYIALDDGAFFVRINNYFVDLYAQN